MSLASRETSGLVYNIASCFLGMSRSQDDGRVRPKLRLYRGIGRRQLFRSSRVSEERTGRGGRDVLGRRRRTATGCAPMGRGGRLDAVDTMRKDGPENTLINVHIYIVRETQIRRVKFRVYIYIYMLYT